MGVDVYLRINNGRGCLPELSQDDWAPLISSHWLKISVHISDELLACQNNNKYSIKRNVYSGIFKQSMEAIVGFTTTYAISAYHH
jgi:hypothetical protein